MSNSEEHGTFILCEELWRLNKMSASKDLECDHSWLNYQIKQKSRIRKFNTVDQG